MFNSLIKEISNTKCWQIDPFVGYTLAHEIRHNAQQRSQVAGGNPILKTTALLVLRAETKRAFRNSNPHLFTADRNRNDLMAQQFVKQELKWGDYREMDRWGDIHDGDEVVNLVNISGPITREGGACSYGSKDVRDEVMYAAQHDNCIGHVFLINSPGGSADSYYDYELACKCAKDRGQKCIGLIDGRAASAAMHLCTLMDEVYYVHPQNQHGCIGVMAMFFTNKDGDQNSITQEVYHEIYADQSEEKNKMFRDIAEGNYAELKELLNENCDEFMQHVTERFPETPDEWLHGKMIKCSETEGIWNNGQGTLETCIESILNAKCGEPKKD